MSNDKVQEILSDSTALKGHVRDILCSRERRRIPQENLRASAVLIPLCFDGCTPYVLVTKRSMSVEHHKGEISFPGGRAEDGDPDIIFTALREADEEIGLKSSDVEILGLLDDHISFVGYHITPVVGAVPYPYDFAINSESEVLLRVPLVHAMKDTAWMAERTVYSGKNINIYYLRIDGGVVWGATGRMLKHFVDLIAGRAIRFGAVSPEVKDWVRGLLALQETYRNKI